MTTAYTNYPTGAGTGTVIQTVSSYSATQTTTSATNTWTEVSNNYRVTIYPQFASSLIMVEYYIPMNINWSGSSNCLQLIRGMRSINGGSFTNLVSSAGPSNGARWQVAGNAYRVLPGYDANDMQAERIRLIDAPNVSGGSYVTYGFNWLQESSNSATVYWNYSNGNNSAWGWTGTVTIVAKEIKQAGN
jgi:hypothetical protein